MSDFISHLIEWLNVNPALASFATFLISTAESIAIVGTLVPGSVMMTAIGALVGAGVIPFWPTLGCATLGAIVGDGVSYWLGFHFKDRIYQLWPFKQYPQILQTGEVFFRKHGSISVFIGRFVGPVRALVPLIAGMFGMRPLIFTIANVTSALIWAPAYMLPGFLLGAASLELPSELAGHLILTLLLWLLLGFLCLWLLRKSLLMLHNKIGQFVDWIWDSLDKSKYFHLFVNTFRHYNNKRPHAQLKLVFYLILVLVLFFYLALDILFQGPASISINKIAFYFFRSLRSPKLDNVFLYITFLGDKYVLLPAVITLFAWFAWIKRWRIATHVLALGGLAAISVSFFKKAVHSARPWGILNNTTDGFSFPSGHAALSFTCYFGMALLLIHIFNIKRRRPLFLLAGSIVIVVSISRLYFGAHWLTDIIGSWLLGSAILMLVTMSYNRKIEKVIKPTGVILTFIFTLLLSYSFQIYHSFNTTKENYTKVEWPVYRVSLNDWWMQTDTHLPLYRVNRFGLKTKIFNLQWVGDLSDITQILLKNGWKMPTSSDWVSILYRLSSVDSTEHLPIVLPLYFDQPPVLVLTKSEPNKPLLILRFWSSYINIKDSKYPLWVGMVEIAPSTYSWLFRKKHFPEASFEPNWVFTTLPSQYDLRMTSVRVKNHHHSKNIPMILIKPHQ
ncbi:MAG: phosphatase PAP2 family protein [Gammaproteobacteria bacterium]|nr:phosphatase PAP2 family protein [Gammaproteobacteria bacterium]